MSDRRVDEHLAAVRRQAGGGRPDELVLVRAEEVVGDDHGVVAGQQGHILDMENEFAETKMTQKMYIEALASETKMDQKYIKRLINKNKNIYIDANEAVKLGIADIIF